MKSPQREGKPVLQCTASLPSLCRVTSVSPTPVQFKDNRFRLEDQASASGLFLLNHRSRGHRGSERLLCALAGKFKVTSFLFQGRGERPSAARSQPGIGRSQECLHSAVTLIGHNGDARPHHRQGPDPSTPFHRSLFML